MNFLTYLPLYDFKIMKICIAEKSELLISLTIIRNRETINNNNNKSTLP